MSLNKQLSALANDIRLTHENTQFGTERLNKLQDLWCNWYEEKNLYGSKSLFYGIKKFLDTNFQHMELSWWDARKTANMNVVGTGWSSYNTPECFVKTFPMNMNKKEYDELKTKIDQLKTKLTKLKYNPPAEENKTLVQNIAELKQKNKFDTIPIFIALWQVAIGPEYDLPEEYDYSKFSDFPDWTTLTSTEKIQVEQAVHEQQKKNNKSNWVIGFYLLSLLFAIITWFGSILTKYKKQRKIFFVINIALMYFMAILNIFMFIWKSCKQTISFTTVVGSTMA